MSERKKKNKDTYASKHDFVCMKIGNLMPTILLAYRNRIPLAVVGGAGIGKTSITRQACQLLTEQTGEVHECRTVICSQKVPEDFTGIPVPDIDRDVVKFLKLDELPRTGKGILFLDEINQADMTVLRAIFQLLGERRIGTYTLPEGWGLVAAMNPDGENYGTTKPSPALRRRLCWVEVEMDEVAFFEYAESRFNDVVLSYLRNHTDSIYNPIALKNDQVFACPASWEQVANVVDSLGPEDRIIDVRAIVAGLVGESISRDFIQFFEQHGTQIDPKQVLDGYHKGNIRSRVQRYADRGRNDILVQVANALVFEMLKVDVESRGFKRKANNVVDFYCDLLEDTAVHFMNLVKKHFGEQGKGLEKKKWVKAITDHPEGKKKMTAMLQTTHIIHKEKAKART